ncbi:MAG: hypothetical protein MPI95_03765 [Nitrosopumilus sp.]|nr:hypothetical protein [Nitrosopumilus sp.]MDA7942502.1 hypothetical protein [Nitrosopumilus sp.]MDA7952619.1 hypothetical protein [Nitrosopumilus sp.]MDA7954291.1 hypothetical protein [Nitrosopumilus sp.]MDA7958192.1 hypothetical protein [Nitrosopumilus sp.]
MVRAGARCLLSPSESPPRVAEAVSNVFAADPEVREGAVVAESGEMESLGIIRDAVRRGRQAAACRRVLEGNAEGGGTVMHLNRQAALAGRVAVCREPDESPLGPLTISVRSATLDEVIDWITG